jgi:hypothetical protein
MGQRVARRKSLFGLPWFELRAEEQLFGAQKLACVYAVGPKGAGRPLQVGATAEPAQRLADIQLGQPVEIELVDIVWLAGTPLARRLVSQVHEILGSKVQRLHGDWFDAGPADVLPAIQAALDQTGLKAMTHDTMLDQVRAEHERRTQAVVQRALRAA